MDERNVAKQAASTRWRPGLWLGKMTGTPKDIVLCADGTVCTTGTVRQQGDESFKETNTGNIAAWLRRIKNIASSRQPQVVQQEVVKVVKTLACGACQTGASKHDARCPHSDNYKVPSKWATALPMAAAALRPREQGADGERPAQPAKRGAAVQQEQQVGEQDSKRQRVHVAEELHDAQPAGVMAVEVPEKEVRYEDDAGWKKAMDAEVESLKKFDVFEWVGVESVPRNAVIIGGRWVHVLKDYDLLYYDRNAAGALAKARYKSRYVAQGFLEPEKDTYASTPSPGKVRIVLTLAAAYGWRVQTGDVTAALLHAPVSGEVYVRPPKHLQSEQPGRVWKLRRALYGLKSAPRSWQQHAASVLEGLGWERMQTDTSMFKCVRGDELVGAAVLYVDDIMAAGEAGVVAAFFDKFAAEVSLKVDPPLVSSGKLHYLGMAIVRTEDGFVLGTTSYISRAPQQCRDG